MLIFILSFHAFNDFLLLKYAFKRSFFSALSYDFIGRLAPDLTFTLELPTDYGFPYNLFTGYNFSARVTSAPLVT